MFFKELNFRGSFNSSDKRKVILLILDGFGIRKKRDFNPVLNADMKNYFNLWNQFPHTKLNASGKLVGLPYGQFGSSEVGHLTIGSGQLIKQPIERINEDINSGEFFKKKELFNGLNFIKKFGGNVHLIGLIGPGGVHSLDSHLYALLEFFDKNIDKIPIGSKVLIDCILDGRDTPQKSALRYLDELSDFISHLYNRDKFFISSLCGRYYAMDRDRRWKRTKKAYDLFVHSEGFQFQSYGDAINCFYKKGVTDEFIPPIRLMSKPVSENDLLIFFNFRADRPRQIVSAFVDKEFDHFEVVKFENLKVITMTEYSPKFDVLVMYKTFYPKFVLGEILSKAGLKQIRIAESEKFPHVTYFFNGLKNDPFKNEERVRIPSPKVATYDLKPDMSINEVVDVVIDSINSNKFQFILVNFANPDMVGHTGNYGAVLKALKVVDNSIKRVYDFAKSNGYLLMITADHGNCEVMRDKDGNPHTEHTNNLVPFIICSKDFVLRKDYHNLSLFNIAPTVLKVLGLSKPSCMEDDLFKR